MTVTVLDDELSAALGTEVTVIRCEPATYRSTHDLLDLTVRAAGGDVMRLLRKDLAPSAVLVEAVRDKPSWAAEPLREIEAYGDVVGPLGLDAPRMLASFADEATQQFWLLLEWVDGVPLWQVGDARTWRDCAAWLAEMHLRSPPSSERLLRHDRGLHRAWLRRAQEHAPPGSLEPVIARHETIVRRLEQWPAGVLHGEFYPSNVLVGRGTAGRRFWAVDWELAGVGPGVLDLAALTSGPGWSFAERERLVCAYHAAWSAGGGPGSLDQLHDTLACARVQIALQWIGWSRCWSPPAEHAHDWLEEALCAVAEVRS